MHLWKYELSISDTKYYDLESHEPVTEKETQHSEFYEIDCC